MEEINLNIEGINNTSQKRGVKESQDGSSVIERTPLADLDTHKIAQAFTLFKKDNRVVVIPVGFPQAGKSLLLSSLMHYARKDKDTLFRVKTHSDYPFDGGKFVADQMIKAFNSGTLIGSTEVGTLDLIGVSIEPSNSKLPTLNLGFIDLAGEDLKKIKTSEGGTFTEKIDAIFNGLKIDNTPIIFTLITPLEPARMSGETIQDAHDSEDTLHYDFLNYIEVNQPHLLRNSKFIIIVSQWDKNPNEKANVEDFIRDYRPSVYNFVKNASVIWGEYSVGQILSSKVDGANVSTIERINVVYPSRFWKKLYTLCTGKNLDQKTFFEKLFGG